jgi:hypothetical protein
MERENHAIAVATDVGKVVVNEAFTYQLGFHENSLWFVLGLSYCDRDGTSLAQIDMHERLRRVISVRYNKELTPGFCSGSIILRSLTDILCVSIT